MPIECCVEYELIQLYQKSSVWCFASSHTSTFELIPAVAMAHTRSRGNSTRQKDRQTDVQTKATLIAPFPTVGGIITCFWLRQTDVGLLVQDAQTSSSSSRMRVINHNWSATKQRLHPQSVAEISRYSVLSGDRIRQCETSSGSRPTATMLTTPRLSVKTAQTDEAEQMRRVSCVAAFAQ